MLSGVATFSNDIKDMLYISIIWVKDGYTTIILRINHFIISVSVRISNVILLMNANMKFEIHIWVNLRIIPSSITLPRWSWCVLSYFLTIRYTKRSASYLILTDSSTPLPILVFLAYLSGSIQERKISLTTPHLIHGRLPLSGSS